MGRKTVCLACGTMHQLMEENGVCKVSAPPGPVRSLSPHLPPPRRSRILAASHSPRFSREKFESLDYSRFIRDQYIPFGPRSRFHVSPDWVSIRTVSVSSMSGLDLSSDPMCL